MGHIYNFKFMTKSNQTPLQRINRIQKFYYSRGQNRESVNSVLRNILKNKFA